MSTSIDIKNKIRAVLPTLSGFTDKAEIPNPYDLEENNFQFIRSGWGIRLGSSTPQTEANYPEYTLTTEYEIIITERVANTQSDADPMHTITDNLMADISTINDDFTATPFSTSTRFSSADKIENVDVISISGIESVSAGKYKNIKASITFGITHWK